MSDYISREKALEILKADEHRIYNTDRKSDFDRGTLKGYCEAISRVIYCPAADVRPVVRGEWIPITERLRSWKHGFEDVTTGYKCSVCGMEERFMEPFCNCGADMRGGSDNV